MVVLFPPLRSFLPKFCDFAKRKLLRVSVCCNRYTEQSSIGVINLRKYQIFMHMYVVSCIHEMYHDATHDDACHRNKEIL